MEDIEDFSSEVKEVMSKPPGAILRWGTSIMCLALGAMVIGTSLISYNDIIQARINITTLNPPVYLDAKTSGRLTDIFVHANQEVFDGSPLAVIESTAQFEDVITLKRAIDTFSIQKSTSIDSFNKIFPPSLVVGSIQEDYNTFLIQFQEYQNYNDLNPNKKEVKTIHEQLMEEMTLLDNQLNQLRLFNDELALAEVGFHRSRKLHNEKVLSDQEFESVTKAFLSEQQKLENLKIVIANTKIELARLRSQKVKLEIDDIGLTRSHSQRLEESIQRLKNSISIWEQLHLIKSPVNGIVGLFDIWNKNQNVKVEQVLFTVIPKSDDSIIGRVTMPVQNSGKVKKGQKVIIKLDNYPFVEWGSLTGKIINIAAVPSQGQGLYTIYVNIDSLKTSSNKSLEFKQEMQGSAEIVTEELTVLDRIFYQFRQVLQRK